MSRSPMRRPGRCDAMLDPIVKLWKGGSGPSIAVAEVLQCLEFGARLWKTSVPPVKLYERPGSWSSGLVWRSQSSSMSKIYAKMWKGGCR